MPTENPTSAQGNCAFKDSFERLYAAGFCVLPANGKKPAWRYANLTQRPTPRFLARKPERFDGLDLVAVPGLTAMWYLNRQWRLIVLDGDDEQALAWIDHHFGWTPGRVKTRRGGHRYWLLPAEIELPVGLTNLRHLGHNVDIKHGSRGAIVVLPPSRHPEDRSFQYQWDGCDETVLERLPPFPLHILEQVLGQRLWALPSETAACTDETALFTDQSHRESRPNARNDGVFSGSQMRETARETFRCPPGGHNVTSNPPPPAPPPGRETATCTDEINPKDAAATNAEDRWERDVFSGMGQVKAQERGGSRELGLNDYLIPIAFGVGSEAELLEEARRANARDFAEPLEDSVVIRVASTVWVDTQTGALKDWGSERIKTSMRTPSGATTLVDGNELDLMLGFGNIGTIAYVLLQKLRVEHLARQLRGETFVIMPRAMARANTLPVGHNAIAAARDLLLTLGYVEKVSSAVFRGRGCTIPAQYRLAQKVEIRREKVETVDHNGEVIETEVVTTAPYIAKHGKAALQALVVAKVRQRPQEAGQEPVEAHDLSSTAEPATPSLAPIKPKQRHPRPWELIGISKANYYRRLKGGEDMEPLVAHALATGGLVQVSTKSRKTSRMSKADRARLLGFPSTAGYAAALRRGRLRREANGV